MVIQITVTWVLFNPILHLPLKYATQEVVLKFQILTYYTNNKMLVYRFVISISPHVHCTGFTSRPCSISGVCRIFMSPPGEAVSFGPDSFVKEILTKQVPHKHFCTL